MIDKKATDKNIAHIDKNVIEIKVKEILSDKLGINSNDIKNTSLLLNDLGIDSFGAIQLLFAVKEEFGVVVLLEDFKTIENVLDVVEYIFNRMGNR